MAEEIGSLEIQIQAQATKANNAIDKLITKLDRLSTSLGSINSSLFSQFPHTKAVIDGFRTM